MFTPYGYVREEMAKAYVRNMLAAQFMGQQVEEDDEPTAHTVDAA